MVSELRVARQARQQKNPDVPEPEPTTGLPAHPFALVPAQRFAPAARRELRVCGAPIELVWLPARAERHGIPTVDRPPFRKSFVERILREETLWRHEGVALTGNRYPFARDQLVLWSETALREPTLPMLHLALRLEEQTHGTLLLNTIGAAASIPRAHVHLVSERLPFLDALPHRSSCPPYLDDQAGVDVLELAAPFPCAGIGVRGAAADRARVVHRLLEIRAAPAVNVVSSRGCTWVFPRAPVEIPTPHFPHALGAAELWGRWCYAERAEFERATSADLEQALRVSGFPV